MADRGSGTGDARPNLSNQAYRPDAEPPAPSPGEIGGTPRPSRLATFWRLQSSSLLHAVLLAVSYQGLSTPAAATNDADPDDADRGPMADPLGDILRAFWLLPILAYSI